MQVRTLKNTNLTEAQKLRAMASRLLYELIREDMTALPVCMSIVKESNIDGIDYKDPQAVADYIFNLGTCLIANEKDEKTGCDLTAYNLGGIMREIMLNDGSGEGYDTNNSTVMDIVAGLISE